MPGEKNETEATIHHVVVNLEEHILEQYPLELINTERVHAAAPPLPFDGEISVL